MFLENDLISKEADISCKQPFLALSKSATSPRAAADLITRATSSPNTFIFAELLQQPQIQALAGNSEHLPYLTLLQTFSYGTYQSYRATPGLPDLNEAQTLKLRQLSLLSLARDRSNLSYQSLQEALCLSSARQLEDLVVTAIYAGLLHATLDPAREAVQVTGISPLRDLAPGSVPSLVSGLSGWSDRCSATLGELDAQVRSIRAVAATREAERRAAADKLQTLVNHEREKDGKKQDVSGREALPRRGLNKRNVGAASMAIADELMDLDEPAGADDQRKRSGKRKM